MNSVFKPENNVIAGYITAALVFAAIHGLAALGVTLTTDQTAALTAGLGVFAAHMMDTYAKWKANKTTPKSDTTPPSQSNVNPK